MTANDKTRLVFEWLDLHEKELLENWERLQKSQQPQKIDPIPPITSSPLINQPLQWH